MQIPTLFLSHGSPMLALEDSPTRRFLQELGRTLPRPKAILVISAHWEVMGGVAVSLATQPETIHDFGGFPPALFAIEYPAPGAPQLANRAATCLEQAGFSVTRSQNRGLDHGAWVPLSLMYPEAGLPVAQIALHHGASAEEHYQMGLALQALRADGVLIIGSGSMTHNLRAIGGAAIDAPAPPWVSSFSVWMQATLQTQAREALLDYRVQAPFALQNHPTDEHLLPLFVALGAAGAAATATHLHGAFEYGVLAMDAYAFS